MPDASDLHTLHRFAVRASSLAVPQWRTMTATAIHAGYIRVSSGRQRDRSDSPASQRQRLADAGCTAFYQDLAVSGFRVQQRRKACDFARLLDDIRGGRIRSLKATRLDRMARRDPLLMELAELCTQHGVTFSTLAGGVVDVSTATGWLTTKVQSVFAEHFSRALSESIRSGYAGLHAAGIPARSAASLSFHLQREPDTRHGVIPSPHWPHARHAVEQLISGAWNPAQVAAHLERTCGRSWASGEARRWLRRPGLAGHMATAKGKILIPNAWPALVTDEEHQQIIAILDATKGRRPVQRERAGLLSGICRCARCDGLLRFERVRRPQGTYLYLRCRKPSCKGGSVAAAPVWEQLLNQLDAHLSVLVARRAADAGQHQEPPEVQAWRRELEVRRLLPADIRQPADEQRIQELEGLMAAAAGVPALVEDWWPDGLSVGSLQFWSERPEQEINADLSRIMRAAIVDLTNGAVVRVDWIGG